MIVRSFVLLFCVLGSIDAVYYSVSDTCPQPRLNYGRVRLRQRSRLVRFACLPRYTLVGSKYATCRNGHWDVPLPTCVRPSCPIPQIHNGLRMLSYGGAWVLFFCFPKFELVGSSTIYCDGFKWNASAPICVDTTSGPALSCDFEDPGLCGWRQDEFHDFDWLRLNFKTPSSFLLTGPSYDHTLGKGRYGHYMYIETTSQIENDTARLISPIYDSALTADGCFTFAYHMYGKTIGGLRVYQMPNIMTLRIMLYLGEEEKRKYLLFEKWGNLGDTWFNSVSPLKNSTADFQIVIEGIRGSSYTSDIAIDDVAILQGENCTEAAKIATTPSTIMPDSCYGRCSDTYTSQDADDTRCGCSVICFINETCCPDYFDICVFTPDSTSADTNPSAVSSSEAEPQTLKLVAVTTESTTTSTTIITTTPTTTARRISSTPKPKPTTLRTTPKTTTTSTTALTTTTTTTTTTTPRPTTRKPNTTTKKPSTPKPTITRKTTPKTWVKTDITPLTKKTIPTIPTTKVPVTNSYKVSKPFDNDNYLETVEKEKAHKEQKVQESISYNDAVTALPLPKGMSESSKTVIVILVLAMLTACALVVHAGLRTTRGRMALARLRGHRERDSEVRYLTSDVDDE